MTEQDTNQKLQLHEELLDITKEQVEIGRVTVRTEVVTETKTITIPVTHEELVIEKRILGADPSHPEAEQIETIRIPVSEERIEIVKHPTVLQDVAIYKNTFEEIVHVEESLLKEKLHIEPFGNPTVIEEKLD